MEYNRDRISLPMEHLSKRNIYDILNPHGNWEDSLAHSLETYKDIYDLPQLSQEEIVSPAFHRYCQKGKYFIIIALYNRDQHFFIQRDLTRNDETWQLVGGWVLPNESFDQALNRIVQQEACDTLIEATPIACVENRYSSAEGQTITHSGLAFLGRVRHDSTHSARGAFMESAESVLKNNNLRIFHLAQDIVRQQSIEPPIEEADTHVGSGIFSAFHKWIVKPISYLGSSRILKKEILKIVYKSDDLQDKKVIDVACGDDKIVYRIAERSQLVVANDIARGAMQGLINESRHQNILFTNHNVLELQFSTQFDIVICKNVMHHMRDPKEIEILLNTLKRLAKKVIIMDIENPRLTLLSRMWNNYYVYLLKDHGGLFMNFTQFKEIIQSVFPNPKGIQFKRVKTIKGSYMLTNIDQSA